MYCNTESQAASWGGAYLITSQRNVVARRKERRMRSQTSTEKMPNQISHVFKF
jgi:hypothetical protein